MFTCKTSARFHSLTEMSPDRNGPDRKVAYHRKLLKNRERWKKFQYSVYSLGDDPRNLGYSVVCNLDQSRGWS